MQNEERTLYAILLKRAKRAMIAITGKTGIERMVIQLRNRKGHNSATSLERLDEFHVTLVSHPPYSLDISSCDFSSFGRSKDAIRGQ
jgi:hypothetical protein